MPTIRQKPWASLVEAVIAIIQGHKAKLIFEYFEPNIDVSEDQQNRRTAVWEYFPIQFLQTRLGSEITTVSQKTWLRIARSCSLSCTRLSNRRRRPEFQCAGIMEGRSSLQAN